MNCNIIAVFVSVSAGVSLCEQVQVPLQVIEDSAYNGQIAKVCKHRVVAELASVSQLDDVEGVVVVFKELWRTIVDRVDYDDILYLEARVNVHEPLKVLQDRSVGHSRTDEIIDIGYWHVFFWWDIEQCCCKVCHVDEGLVGRAVKVVGDSWIGKVRLELL